MPASSKTAIRISSHSIGDCWIETVMHKKYMEVTRESKRVLAKESGAEGGWSGQGSMAKNEKGALFLSKKMSKFRPLVEGQHWQTRIGT